MNRDIFRQYDIRGIVPDTFNKEIAAKIGNAIGLKAIENFSKKHPSISVGRDVRLSSDEIFEGLAVGLTDAGCRVINLGVVPTPVTYFSSEILKTDGFIMITGSHNPPEYNGLKFGLGNKTIHSEGIIEIYNQITKHDYFMAPVKGFIEKYEIIKDYLEFYDNKFANLKSNVRKIKKIKVVIDAGNGVASKVAPIIFRNLGVEVIELFCEPDGRFPNHHPDPTVEKNLIDAKKSVIENSGDFAVAFDGDADRIGVLDEKGDIIWGDILLYIYARELKKKYQKPVIIADVKSSQVLFDSLEKIGIEGVMWNTGHSLIKDKLKETKAELAGEMSGHIFFSDGYFGFDDAIYAAVRFLEVYVNNLIDGNITKTSDLVKDLPKVFNTPEIRFDCPDNIKFQVVEKFKNVFKNYASKGKFGIKSIIDIDGIRVNFQNGWGLLRSSNTQPVLVMRFEADSEENMYSYWSIFNEELKKLN